MDREQMKMAILNQEQIFRQQVHELHRLYHVQTQLMRQMPAAVSRRAPAIADVKPRPPLDILLVRGERAMATADVHAQRLISFSSCAPPAAAAAGECNLELTLATGGATTASSSGGGGCDGGTLPAKRAKLSPADNSDSGTTAAVSSTSTESELVLFGEADAATTAAPAPVRFQVEGKRIGGELGHGAWMHQQQQQQLQQCLSLRMA
ncbi:hypothetical protein ACP4OV_002375 [Aristida adscensionis]